MKIHKLHIRNLNSLNTTETIDFNASPLAETGIFAIMGPTGAGKSTLLDAITLALYGQIPRSDQKINKTAIEESGFIITDMAEDCYAVVDYEAGGTMYRSKWSISRNRNGGLRDYHMELASLDSGKFLVDRKSEVPGKNEELIGLKYDQFVKSILLAQGQFTRFLKARPVERGEILETITGTEIYRKIGQAAFEKMRQEKEKLEQLQQRSTDIQLLTEGELHEKKARLQTLEDEMKRFQKSVAQVRKQQQIKEQLKDLNEKAEKTQKSLSAHQEKLNALKPEIEKLQQHEKLVWLKGDFTALRKAEKQLEEMHKQIQTLTNSRHKKQKEQEALQKQMEQARQQHEQNQKQLEVQKPLWTEVREQDRLITQKQDLLNEKQKQVQQGQKELQDIEKQLGQQEKELQAKQKSFEKRARWLEDHKVLQHLPGELAFIHDRQQQFVRKAGDMHQLLKAERQSQWGKAVLAADTYAARLKLLKEYNAQFDAQIAKLQQKTTHEPGELDALQEQLYLNNQAQHAVENLAKLQKAYSTTQKHLKETAQKITRQKDELKKQQSYIPKLDHELEILDKKLQELQTRFEREQLEAKYEQDRLKLQKGEPCYLCGSTEHPYVRKNKQVAPGLTKQEITQTQQEQQKLQKERSNAIAKKESSLATMQSLQEQHDTLEATLNDNKGQFQEICQTWDWVLQPDQTNTLSEKRDNLRREGEDIKTSIEQLKQIRHLTEAHGQIVDFVKRAEELTALEQELERYWQTYAFYLQDVQDSEQKYNRLEERSGQYQHEAENQQDLEQKIQTLKTTQKNLREQAEKAESQLQTLQKEAADQKKDLEKLQEARYAKFGKKDPDTEQEKLQEELQKKQKQVNSLEKQLSALQAEMDGLQRQATDLQQQAQNLKNDNDEKTQNLLEQVASYGYTRIAEAEAAMLEQQEAKDIRSRWTEVEDARKAAAQSLKDAQQQTEVLKKQDDESLSLEAVLQKLQEEEKQLAAVNEEKGSISQALSHDQEQRTQYQNLQKQLAAQQAEYAKWQGLSDHIGDKQGRKFSTFAQELTMAQLLRLANQHLKRFNPRYVLSKMQGRDNHNKDDLIVVDTFQGHSTRSVSTLSGGESFLVSLALALGLSDLAGGRSKISSLFIDEGFGSLDRASLDLALDTLEKLQTETNRTIGIISHVQALKDRIATRIELQRTSGGYSSLQVVSD